MTPKTDIRYLKGVGEQRAARYQKLGIKTVQDLLLHLPRHYVDLRSPFSIAEAPNEIPCAVRACLTAKSREQRIRAGFSVFKLRAEDETGALELTFYNSRYTVEKLQTGREYCFYGRVEHAGRKRSMSAPAVYPVDSTTDMIPVYPQTAGLSSAMIRGNVQQALSLLQDPADPLPESVREELALPPLLEALRQAHFPDNPLQAQQARRRFVLEEMLTLSLSMSLLRRERELVPSLRMTPAPMDEFYRQLPFSPTAAQLRCIQEATADLCTPVQMNRLVQGDVGSGKTLIAAACVWLAFRNGVQSAVMAPTTLLAEQHHATFRTLLEPFGIECLLLTGSTSAAGKRAVLKRLASDEPCACIGTHALLSEGVAFRNLSLVITDEQHRFGVRQRAALSEKSAHAHVLVLSATPIPRTLSLIVYGDLSLSVVDELPLGRRPVKTLVINGEKRERALGFIRNALDEGRQAYIVCPLIEQGEVETALRPAIDYARQLQTHAFRGYQIGLLHGKMKARDKEDVMQRFRQGEIQLLVSTTVVEVGVDVPNATIMLIENADRFGLSQLHQLRGRVGRGQEQSWCILVSDAKGAAARERLMVMKSTGDGFVIAEHDLKQRGPGDFLGYRQHGLPELRFASFADNLQTAQTARDLADRLLEQDPALSLPEHAGLAHSVKTMLRAVGARPN